MEIKNNQAFVQNIALDSLVHKYGSPLYVYDFAVIESQYRRLKTAFSNVDADLHFACKSLSNISVLSFIRSLGAGLDAVSPQEVQLGLLAGFKPENIVFTPNCGPMDDYINAVKQGIKINIDSLTILEKFGETYGASVPVCVRINPHVMAGGNIKISTGHIDSKFGISITQKEQIKTIVKKYSMNIEGLHLHTGSDIKDIDAFLLSADAMFSIASEFSDLKYIDLGSGFKVKYKKDDIETNIPELGQRLSERFLSFCNSYGRKLKLIFEPGKFIVSEAGMLLATVNVVKVGPTTTFACLNTGFNHLIRPMFYNAHHDIVNISNITAPVKSYAVVGNICETDTFAWDRELNEVRENDILMFKNAGAYSFSMASNFNSRFKPAEVMIYNGIDNLIRQRDTMDDILRNQLQPITF